MTSLAAIIFLAAALLGIESIAFGLALYAPRWIDNALALEAMGDTP